MMQANLPGGPLTERDYELLECCFISRDLADRAGLRRVSDPEGRLLIGVNGRPGDYSGIAIPYISPADHKVHEYRLRRDHPDLEERDGRQVEKAKYLSPPGARNRLYFVPGTHVCWLQDPQIPIVIVEGEKKSLALWSVAWQGLGDAAEEPPFVPVGLPGVYNWRGRIGKAETATGEERDVHGVIPDLHTIVWPGRTVTILFDSNVHTNEYVRRARQHFAGWLSGQGAKVKLADLPAEQGVNGPDDAAGKHGPQYLLDLLDRALPFEPSGPPAVLSPAEEKLVQERPYAGFLRNYERHSSGRLREVPPEYHTVVGLVLMAGVLGGKLTTPTGLRPSLAAVIVGLQGFGKSLPTVIARDLIEEIEEEEKAAFVAKLSHLKRQVRQLQRDKTSKDGDHEIQIQEEIETMEGTGRPAIIIATQASVEGLLEALSHQPCGIVDFDELGAFLKDCERHAVGQRKRRKGVGRTASLLPPSTGPER